LLARELGAEKLEETGWRRIGHDHRAMVVASPWCSSIYYHTWYHLQSRHCCDAYHLIAKKAASCQFVHGNPGCRL